MREQYGHYKAVNDWQSSIIDDEEKSIMCCRWINLELILLSHTLSTSESKAWVMRLFLSFQRSFKHY